MDYTQLTFEIRKNPNEYKKEFNEVYNSYKNLSILPYVMKNQITPVLSFLSDVSHLYETDYPQQLVLQLKVTNDENLKKIIIEHLFISKKKQRIPEDEFFNALLQHADLHKMQNRCYKHVTNKLSLKVFEKYIKVGSEKQSLLSMVMMCYIFEKFMWDECLETIYNGIYGTEKLQRIVMLYLINGIKFEDEQEEVKHDLYEETEDENKLAQNIGSFRATKLCKHLMNNFSNNTREKRILILRCIDVLKKENNIKIDIFNLIYKHLDPSKDDFKVLLKLFLDNVDHNKEVLHRFFKDFCSEYKDDEIIVYGINLLTAAYTKYGISFSDELSIFNRHKTASVNFAYRCYLRAIKGKLTEEDKGLFFMKKKLNKEERMESTKVVNRAKFKKKDRKKQKKNARKKK